MPLSRPLCRFFRPTDQARVSPQVDQSSEASGHHQSSVSTIEGCRRSGLAGPRIGAAMHLEAVPHAQRDRARVAPRSWPPEAVAVPEAVRIHRSPLAAIAPLLPKGDTSIRMPLVLRLAHPPLQVPTTRPMCYQGLLTQHQIPSHQLLQQGISDALISAAAQPPWAWWL